MFSRLGIAAFVAVLLALPISIGFASTNPYPVGMAYLYETQSSGVTGRAVVTRQLTAGETHVMARMGGLRVGQQVTWQIVAGAYCGSKPTSTLLRQIGASIATGLGTVMVSDYQSATLNVTSGSAQMTLRIYDSAGAELACGQIYGQPSLGSQHWW